MAKKHELTEFVEACEPATCEQSEDEDFENSTVQSLIHSYKNSGSESDCEEAGDGSSENSTESDCEEFKDDDATGTESDSDNDQEDSTEDDSDNRSDDESEVSTAQGVTPPVLVLAKASRDSHFLWNICQMRSGWC